MLRYLLEKEFKQFFRNKFLPKMVVMLPFLALAIFPLVANMDVKNLSFGIIDNDGSRTSQQMQHKIASSGFFKNNVHFDTYDAALQQIEKGNIAILLEIPPKFESDLNRGNPVEVFLAADAVNGMQGGLGIAYLNSIISDYNAEIIERQMPTASVNAGIEVRPLFRYNSTLNYRIFMIPALMAMMLAMICGFLPALNIVSEKERGTIEQMNVTPVNKFVFILSKLIPYWVAGFVVATLCMLTAFLFYGMAPKSSILLIYLFAAVFVLCFSGFGLIVSNYAQSIQQAIFIMFFFVITMIYLSGLFTPFQNMPDWAQLIGNASPLKYFIQVLRMIYLKGAGFMEMQHLFYPLCLLALIFNGWAMLSYRKKRG